jgi:hypothetical protein
VRWERRQQVSILCSSQISQGSPKRFLANVLIGCVVTFDLERGLVESLEAEGDDSRDKSKEGLEVWCLSPRYNIQISNGTLGNLGGISLCLERLGEVVCDVLSGRWPADQG